MAPGRTAALHDAPGLAWPVRKRGGYVVTVQVPTLFWQH